MVSSIFENFSKWRICLSYDKLVMCHDMEDGLRKLDTGIVRCLKRRVVSYFAKKLIRLQEVKLSDII